MLILTRKKGEKIVLGNNIFITVLGRQGNQVRLGVDAPKALSVHREEVYNQIKKGQTKVVFKNRSSQLNGDYQSHQNWIN